VVNLDRLAKLRREDIGPKDMAEVGLIKKETERVKVLGRGDLVSAKTIRAHEFSDSAVKKIEAKGGRAVVIGKD
jgi:large subunit ribosomal protein L15